MIIGNDDFDKENPQSQPIYLISETEIQALVSGLRVSKSQEVTSRLIATLLAIFEMMRKPLDAKSKETNLLLIKQLAQDYKNKQYQSLMSAVIDSLEPGKESFNPVLATLAHTLELIYSSWPGYSTAREFYEVRMNQIGEEENEG